MNVSKRVAAGDNNLVQRCDEHKESNCVYTASSSPAMWDMSSAVGFGGPLASVKKGAFDGTVAGTCCGCNR